MTEEGALGDHGFAIDLTFSGGSAIITMSGELDISTASFLHDCVRQAMEAGSNEIVCDLANVTYMDSTGLSVFLITQKRMSRQKGTFVVQSPPPVIERLLLISGLGAHFTVRTVPSAET
jgi:anti-anti-sigma factor